MKPCPDSCTHHARNRDCPFKDCVSCGKHTHVTAGGTCMRCDNADPDLTDEELDAWVDWQAMKPGAKLPRSMFQAKTAAAKDVAHLRGCHDWNARWERMAIRRIDPLEDPEGFRRMAGSEALKRALARAREEGRLAVQRKMAFYQPLVETPEDARSLRNHELAGGALGGLAGSALGGTVMNRKYGPLGAVAGGLAGAAVGSLPGKMLGSVAYDMPRRAEGQYHRSMHRLEAASGDNLRIASALPTAEEFIEFAREHEEGSPEIPETANEAITNERMQSPGWGNSSSLEGGDVATRTMQMGLPQYKGV